MRDPSSVDWAAFDDESETFTWVPQALEELGSTERKVRRAAIRRLDEGLVHQGGVFLPAAAAAMPFLLDHIRQGGDELEPLIRLATEMALAGHANHVEAGWGESSPLARAAGEPEVRRSFVDAIDTIAAHASRGKAGLRAAALLALAFTPERAADHLPVVLEQVGERSKVVRFGARLAAGLLARASDDADAIWDVVDAGLAGSSEDRWSAAIAWAWASPDALDEARVRAGLVEAASAKDVASLLWCDGRIASLASRVLAAAVSRDGRQHVALAILDQVEGSGAELDVTTALVDQSFRDAPEPEGTLRRWDEMTASQQRLLVRIAGRQRTTSVAVEGVASWVLVRHGLVDLGADLRRLVGLEPASSLEQHVEGRPLWWHLLEARDDPRRRASVVSAVMAAAVDVRALADDAITGPYRLDTQWPPSSRGDRVAGLAATLAELVVAGLERDAAIEWVRGVAEGPLDDWNRALLAAVVARRVGALADLEPATRERLVATARQLSADGVRELLES